MAERGLRHKAAIGASRIGKRLARSLARYEMVEGSENVEARNSLLRKRNQDVVAFGRLSAEVDNLVKLGNAEGKQFVFVLDEGSMTGTADTLTILNTAKQLGARVVVQGDVNQHHSISAGRAMTQLKELGVNFSYLSEAYRFKGASEKTKSAMEMLTLGDYAEGFKRLPYVEYQGDLRAAVTEEYEKAMANLKNIGISKPSIGVVVLTNMDRKTVSHGVHEMLERTGVISGSATTFDHFDVSNLTKVQKKFVNELVKWRDESPKEFIANGQVELYALFDKAYPKKGIVKHDVIKITGFDITKNVLTGQSEMTGKTLKFNPMIEDFFSLARKEWRKFSKGERVVARHIINLNEDQFLRPEVKLSKQAEKDLTRIKNGLPGTVVATDAKGATIEWSDGREITLDTKQLRMVDWAYARTTIKEQGNDNHVELFGVSEIGNFILKDRAGYVGATRGKIDTILITPDRETTLKAVGVADTKSTALEIKAGQSIDDSIARAWEKIAAHRDEALASNGRAIDIAQAPEKLIRPSETVRTPQHDLGRSM